jgi:tetratricopeptide (TPR) repeat protein
VGKASRRKKERAEAGTDAAATDRSGTAGRDQRAPRNWAALAMLAIVLLALGFGAWRLLGTGDEEREPALVLPAPDTSGMTKPVADAIESARRAALANPGAVGHFGQVLHAHWLLEAAEQCYGIAHEVAPQDFRWAYLLAGVAEILGADAEKTGLLFQEALRRAPPGFAPVFVRYADALMRLGRWTDARDNYAQAAALDPELVLAHRGLGQALIQLGDGVAAVEHLERAAALSPNDRISRVALARAYALAGDDQRAAEISKEAEQARGSAPLPDPIFFEVERLAVDPESLRSRYARNLRRGDVQAAAEAARLLEESGDPAPSRQLPLAVKQHANQLAFAGDFDKALAAYEEAARLAPNDPEIEHNWGTVLLRRGELEAAAEHFERAVALNPDSADSLYNLGVALEGLGRDDQAIAHFRAAAAIEPQHPAAQRLAELGLTPEP